MSEIVLAMRQTQEKTLQREPILPTRAKSNKFSNNLRKRISQPSKKKKRRRLSLHLK